MTSWHDGRKLVVASADPGALALGLVPGLPLAEAQARVPDLAVFPADPAREAAARRRLARLCLRYAPLTAPAEDGIAIDATGCAHLFGGERRMLGRMVADLADLGFTARAAIAGTLGAAHALARHGATDGLVVVAPGDEEATLAHLPVEALRLSPRTAAALRRLGLGTVDAVRRLPRAALGRRFGAELLCRLDQASGRVFESIGPEAPERPVASRLGFVEPLLTAEAFGTVIARLASDVAIQLESQGAGARRLELGFERVDGTQAVLRAATARPVRDAALLARLLAARLETVDPGLGVEAMFLRVRRAAPLAPVQVAPSFAPALASGLGRGLDPVSPLVDSLVNRLGPDRVWRETPVESDVPERSVARIAPLALASGAAWPDHLPRPVRLLEPPHPVEVMALLPDHPPASFTWRRIRHRVRHADGPERIAGEWWRGPREVRALRDYFRVEDDEGRRFWLFRRGDGTDPETGDMRWFLHGLF